MSYETLVSTLLTLLLGAGGLLFLSRGGSVFLRHPRLLIAPQKRSQKHRAEGSISPFSAMCVALGGTIGVGNTVGVASAICLGGAGAVFWMWVSGFFGLTLKYAEVYLSQLHKNGKGLGGAMVLLEKLKMPRLAKLFSFCCLLVSLGMGNLAQTSAAAESLAACTEIPPLVCGGLLCALCILIFSGGLKRLSRFCTFAVPLTSAVFFLLCLLCLLENIDAVPRAIRLIFEDVFSPKAFAGGIFGGAFSRALSAGFTRGIFSNEAGLGSAPLVHTSSRATPQEQGIWGAREVCLDTHVVCSITALVLLSSDAYRQGERDAARLCLSVFSEAFPNFGAPLCAACLFFFAAASILAWAYYGKRAAEHLFRYPIFQIFYYIFFFAAIFLGARLKLDGAFLLSDTANLCMASINLYALFRFRRDCKFPTPPSHCLQFIHNSRKTYGKIESDEGE